MPSALRDLYDLDYKLPDVSADPTKDPLGFVGGDANLYGYAAGGPTNFADPTGQFLPIVGACAFGAATAIGTDFVFFLMAGGRKDQAPSRAGLLGSALGGCVTGLLAGALPVRLLAIPHVALA